MDLTPAERDEVAVLNVLHELDVRINGIERDACHCGLVAKVVLNALKLDEQRQAAYRAGREDAARALEAEADDEAKRPGRNCCSHKIEGWLRAAAEVAQSGSYLGIAEPLPRQVWAVILSNYEPAEVDSLHADRADAEARAREMGNDWAAVRMAISLGRSAGRDGDNPEEQR